MAKYYQASGNGQRYFIYCDDYTVLEKRHVFSSCTYACVIGINLFRCSNNVPDLRLCRSMKVRQISQTKAKKMYEYIDVAQKAVNAVLLQL